MQSFHGRLTSPQSVAFNADGRLLAVSGFGVQVWDTREERPVGPVCAQSPYFGWDVAFTPDGRLMLANGNLGWLAVDPTTGNGHQLDEFVKNSPQAMATDGHYAVIATVVLPVTVVGPWRSVKVWAYRTDETPCRRLWTREVQAAFINRLRVVPGGESLVCVEHRAFQAEGPTNKLTIVLRSRADGRLLAEAPLPAEGVTALTVSHNGRWAAACAGARVLLWDLSDVRRKPRRLVNPSRKHVRCAAFSPAGGVLAVGGNDGLIWFWDADSGKRIKSFDWGLGKVGAIGFTPDGLRCAAAGDKGKVVVWDLDD